MEYDYYEFMGNIVRKSKDQSELGRHEFYVNGEWKYSRERSRDICDAKMDYGDYSCLDYRDITEEQAMKLIKEEDKERIKARYEQD